MSRDYNREDQILREPRITPRVSFVPMPPSSRSQAASLSHRPEPDTLYRTPGVARDPELYPLLQVDPPYRYQNFNAADQPDYYDLRETSRENREPPSRLNQPIDSRVDYRFNQQHRNFDYSERYSNQIDRDRQHLDRRTYNNNRGLARRDYYFRCQDEYSTSRLS